MRPKVKVSFAVSNFQVTYGKTVDLCMKVTPPTRFTPKIKFGSNPAGALEGKIGGSATCESSYTSFQVKASTSACVGAATLQAKVNGKTVATLPGTILLPDRVYATLRPGAGGCGSEAPYGALNAYFIHFESSVDGAAPNFDDLTVTEHLDTDGQPNSCEVLTNYTPAPWTMGESPAIHNTIDDNNGKCSPTPLNCKTIINQTFTVGSCTTSVRTITVTLSNGTGTVVRSDE